MKKIPDLIFIIDTNIESLAVAEAKKPVMLYSLGKDSSVMLHLAKKAFYPQPPPFPFLHVDTGWKFQAMYDFRDYIKKNEDFELLIYKNPEGLKKNINPFSNNSEIHTSIMKTEALKIALKKYLNTASAIRCKK